MCSSRVPCRTYHLVSEPVLTTMIALSKLLCEHVTRYDEIRVREFRNSTGGACHSSLTLRAPMFEDLRFVGCCGGTMKDTILSKQCFDAHLFSITTLLPTCYKCFVFFILSLFSLFSLGGSQLAVLLSSFPCTAIICKKISS